MSIKQMKYLLSVSLIPWFLSDNSYILEIVYPIYKQLFLKSKRQNISTFLNKYSVNTVVQIHCEENQKKKEDDNYTAGIVDKVHAQMECSVANYTTCDSLNL